MRAYFLTNMYLSSLQVGLQSAHTIAEMFVKANVPTTTSFATLHDWAEHHKTIIILNGGYSSTLVEFEERMYSKDNPYPWASFRESHDALNNALTCVGIILPERMYELSRILRMNDPEANHQINKFQELDVPVVNNFGITTEEHIFWLFTEWEIELAKTLTQFSLAG